MVKVSFENKFKRLFSKVKDDSTKGKIVTQLEKIRNNPLVGKPMRNVRKGTREVYVGSFRLMYIYLEKEDLVVILDLYHKDNQ